MIINLNEEISMNEKEYRDPIPKNSIWTVEDLANYLDTDAALIMQSLTENLGQRYKLKLISLDGLFK